MKNFVATLALTVLLFACTGSQQVEMHTDEFSKEVEIDGPKSKAHPFVFSKNDIIWIWQLQGFVNKQSGAARYQLVAQFQYFTNLKYIRFATDQDANTLKLVPLYQVGGRCSSNDCKRVEKIAVLFSEEELQRHVTTGYKIKVSAKNGDAYVLALSPETIRDVLATTRQYAQSVVNADK